MQKQRICIIGDGLSGLTCAVALKNLQNIDVHLFLDTNKKKRDERTTAVSESNYDFLKNNIKNFKPNIFWPSKSIELFYEFKKIQMNFLNFDDNKKKLMYVFENKKLKDLLLKEIYLKKIKCFRKNIKNLQSLKKYDLIILCLGTFSNLYKLTGNRAIKKDYKELAITGQVKHNIDNLKASQFFLNEGPLAILPFAKNKFSFVWTISKNLYENNSQIIHDYTKKKIKNILKPDSKIKINNLQFYPIQLNLKSKYFADNILILGEGLHRVHPVAGQGFNLVLRDINQLQKNIKYYLQLGIQLKTSNILSDFTKARKPENLIFGIGIDLTRSFFKKNDYLDPFKKIILEQANKIPQLKELSTKISNSGLGSI
tara:strand:+ start:2103 stop:3212 length:1110 start_codon:yes stop_codon:yes gene_type:complete